MLSKKVVCAAVAAALAGCAANPGDKGGRSGTGGQIAAGSGGATAGTPGSGGGSGAAPAGSGGISSTGGVVGTGGASGEGGTAGLGGGPGGRPGSGGNAGTVGTSTGGVPGIGGASAGPGKFVGNITTSGAVRDGFAKQWNQITPENEGKWGSVQSSQASFDWTALDKIYAYAGTNNVVFKEHNFVWGNQQPSWVNATNAQVAVKAWMQAFCARYPNTKLIDVVNEPPPHTTPAYIDGMGGAGTTGYDWIVNAFKWARAACPGAILILNDYNNIEYSADNARTIDIVNRVRAAGGPIDAIGAQAHDAYKLPSATVKGFIDKLAATGLPVYITEYDIDLADDTQQKTVMQDQFSMFWSHSAIQGITLWGYVVGATWKPNTGLQKTDGTLRPALSWLMTFLGR